MSIVNRSNRKLARPIASHAIKIRIAVKCAHRGLVRSLKPDFEPVLKGLGGGTPGLLASMAQDWDQLLLQSENLVRSVREE